MGRRSRNRSSAPARSQPAAPAATTGKDGGRSAKRPPKTLRPTRRSRYGEPPPAPWGSFPLAEVSVLFALLLGVTGLLTGGREGKILIACAAVLGSLAGLELSLREHMAGFRSHSTVIAGGIAVLTLAVLFFAGVSSLLMLPIAAAVFATAFFALREIFKRRSGGSGFR
ncbi:MAG: MgtC/SapB family protein [Actinomycetota bacterium]